MDYKKISWRLIPLSASAALMFMSFTTFASEKAIPKGDTMPSYHADTDQPKVKVPKVDLKTKQEKIKEVPKESKKPAVKKESKDSNNKDSDNRKQSKSKKTTISTLMSEEDNTDKSKNIPSKEVEEEALEEFQDNSTELPKETSSKTTYTSKSTITPKQESTKQNTTQPTTKDIQVTPNTSTSAPPNSGTKEIALPQKKPTSPTKKTNIENKQLETKQNSTQPTKTPKSTASSNLPKTQDGVKLPDTASPLIPLALQGASLALLGLGLLPRKKK